MKAEKFGLFAALMASVCCVTPLVLVLLGLGGLGIGAVLGRFHWWFLFAAIVLLTADWRAYFRERGRCRATGCTMSHQKATQTVLGTASIIVAAFVGLNLYTYAGQQTAPLHQPANSKLASIVLPVEGMTCLTCELTIESSLKKLPGVEDVDARVATQSVWVRYNPARATKVDLINTISGAGYKVKE
ncbi:MAG: heavy-metal-associated domain-containing protein [Candidatus Omnitrophica bacterium]|nr:heavy-metal-associated domain-containing protein [Candidatus Omnitrophota bacterium]